MAHDLILGKTKRNWSREQNTANSTGYAPYARSLFERSSLPENRPIVIERQPVQIGWFGATVAAMLATRMLSGKWPWYWAGLAAKKLESSPTHQKG
jgi:hypothetical protein